MSSVKQCVCFSKLRFQTFSVVQVTKVVWVSEEGDVLLPPGGRGEHVHIGIPACPKLTEKTTQRQSEPILHRFKILLHLYKHMYTYLNCSMLILCLIFFPYWVLFPPRVFLWLQVMVKAAETVLMECIGHTLMVAFAVFLQVFKQIAMTAVLENQVCWSYMGKTTVIIVTTVTLSHVDQLRWYQNFKLHNLTASSESPILLSVGGIHCTQM